MNFITKLLHYRNTESRFYWKSSAPLSWHDLLFVLPIATVSWSCCVACFFFYFFSLVARISLQQVGERWVNLVSVARWCVPTWNWISCCTYLCSRTGGQTCHLQQEPLLKGMREARTLEVSAEALSVQCAGPWRWTIGIHWIVPSKTGHFQTYQERILPMSPNYRVPFSNGLRCKCLVIHWVSTFDGLLKLLTRSKACLGVCVTLPAGAQNVLAADAQHLLAGLKLLMYGSKVIAPRRDRVWVSPSRISMLGMLKRIAESFFSWCCFHFNHFLNIVQKGHAPIITCSLHLRLECIFFPV